MATELVEYKFRSGRASHNYPWEEWTNGKPWSVEQGKDFTCSVESFQNSVYTTARKRGLKVRTNLEKDSDPVVCVFQFIAPEGAEASTNGSAPKKRPARKRTASKQ